MRRGYHSVRSIITAAALAVLTGAAANADVLYQNPDPISSTPGNVDAWTINFDFSVSDSFTLGSNSNLSSIDFETWNVPGDHITSVDWIISTDAGDLGGAGTSLGSGTAAVTDALLAADNGLGWNLELNTFDLSLNLSPGTYWLTLQNAVTSGDNAVYWDQGGGSSQAWENSIGFLNADHGCGQPDGFADTNGSCAETFRINGTAGTQVPEPITLSLFGAGLVATFAARRRRTKAA